MAKNNGIPGSTNSHWVEVIKEKLNYESWKHYLTFSNIMQLLIYFFVGFITGLLLKRFGRHFVFTVIVGGILLYVLHHFHVISLDLDQLRSMLGIGSSDTVGSLFQNLFEWVKNHILVSSSAVLGFFLGYKAG